MDSRALLLLVAIALIAGLGLVLARYILHALGTVTKTDRTVQVWRFLVRASRALLLLSLPIPTAIIVLNPAVSSQGTSLLTPYVLAFYVCVGVTLSSLIVLLAMAVYWAARYYGNQSHNTEFLEGMFLDKPVDYRQHRGKEQADFVSAYIDYALIGNGMNKGQPSLDPPDQPD